MARLVLDRDGALGDTPQEVADSVRAYADDLEAALTMELLLDPEAPEAGTSTAEQRLTTDSLHVWKVFDVEVDADTELDGDPVCVVRFTAFCQYLSPS